MIERIKAWWQDITEQEKEEEEIKLNNVFKEKESTKRKMRKRINTLECENEMLKNAIKDELYKLFMKKLSESESDKRLKSDNDRLRKQVKTLKEIIKEERR